MLLVLCAGFVAIYLVAMSWPGLLSGFSQDDLMNLSFAVRDGWWKLLRGNLLFFSGENRPFGQLFYLAFFKLFGFNSLPFRIFCFSALGLNLYVLYRLTRQVTGSREAGMIAPLLVAWHGNLSPLFFGSGNCYDVFGVLFYLATLTFYISVRQQATTSASLIFATLQICALNSKEFAVTVPLVLLVWELLFSQPRTVALLHPRREGRLLWLSGVLSAGFALGKILNPELMAHPAYRPDLSFGAYFRAMAVFLNDLSYRTDMFSGKSAIGVATAMILMGAVLRSRSVLFGSIMALVAPLPVMLVTPRGLASHYITVCALALAVSAGLAGIVRRRYATAAAFAGVAVLLLYVHLPRRQFQIDSWNHELIPIQLASDSWKRHPEWYSVTPVLIVKDAFEERWATTFIATLVAGNPDLQIVRAADLRSTPGRLPSDHYGLALAWTGTEFAAVDPSLAER